MSEQDQWPRWEDLSNQARYNFLRLFDYIKARPIFDLINEPEDQPEDDSHTNRPTKESTPNPNPNDTTG